MSSLVLSCDSGKRQVYFKPSVIAASPVLMYGYHGVRGHWTPCLWPQPLGPLSWSPACLGSKVKWCRVLLSSGWEIVCACAALLSLGRDAKRKENIKVNSKEKNGNKEVWLSTESPSHEASQECRRGEITRAGGGIWH